MTNTHRILVLGAGYAGLAATAQLAARLRRDDRAELTLVNATENFTERMRLPQTTTGQAVAALSIPALLAGTAARFVCARVTGIDVHNRTVSLDSGTPLHYDTLVYALGTVTDTTSVPGAAAHAHTLDGAGPLGASRWTADHAHALDGTRPTSGDGRGLGCGSASDDARTRSGSSPIAVTGPGALDGPQPTSGGSPGVVVVGSGLSGIETAAEIAERHPGRTVTLVGPHEPGADLHPRARTYLQAALARLGVRYLRATVTRVRPGAVDLADGTTIPAGPILWAAGNRVAAPPDGLHTDPRGRIVTDEFLRAVEHPEVYAIGDAAAVRQRYGTMHGTCQSGMPTGVHAALQITRALASRPRAGRSGTSRPVASRTEGANRTENSRTENSRTETSRTETSRTETSRTETSRTETSRTEASRTEANLTELEPFRFGYYQTPISLGRRDAVVQFTHPDGSPRRLFLTGRPAARYKEVVTAAPWPTFARMLRRPASGAWWPSGGRHTR